MSNRVFAGIPALEQIEKLAERAPIKIKVKPVYRNKDKHLPPRMYLKRIKINGIEFRVWSPKRIQGGSRLRSYVQTSWSTGIEKLEGNSPCLAFPIKVTTPDDQVVAESFFIPLALYLREFPDGRARIPIEPPKAKAGAPARIDWSRYAGIEGLRRCFSYVRSEKRRKKKS